MRNRLKPFLNKTITFRGIYDGFSVGNGKTYKSRICIKNPKIINYPHCFDSHIWIPYNPKGLIIGDLIEVTGYVDYYKKGYHGASASENLGIKFVDNVIKI